MHIAFSCDAKYAPYLATIMASILLNSAENDSFFFHILDGGLTPQDRKKLESLKKYKDFKIEYIEFDYDLVKDWPIGAHFSKAIYFRFFIAELIPDADRILYLDVDMVVTTSLAPLYNLDLGQYILGAAKRIINFNSGLLLIDAKAWRKWGIASKLVQLTNKLRDQIVMYDQDVLNHFFQSKYLHISEKWNQKHVDVTSIEDVHIIHYTSQNKFCHPSSLQLIQYLRCTEYQTFNSQSLAELAIHNAYDKIQAAAGQPI